MSEPTRDWGDKPCTLCGTGMTGLTLHRKTADASLCPNCAIVWAIGYLKAPERAKLAALGEFADQKMECCLCSANGIANSAVATVHDFKFNEARTDVQWHVCEIHARTFERLNLHPNDVKALTKIAGVRETFMTHSDFYDEDGNAVQPR